MACGAFYCHKPGLGRIDPKQASDCFEKSLKQEARSAEAIFGLEAAEHRSRLLRRTEAIGASKKQTA